jgi:serine/threonine protein kinase
MPLSTDVDSAALAESSDTDPLPLLLGRYRPDTLIGRGGVSTVFRARDEVLDRDVAVKVFRAGAAEDFAQHRTEIVMLASLSHHGLVSLLDAGIDDSLPSDPRPILVMELIPGETLQQALTARELTAREIAEIAYDLGEALEYVHAQGVVHRDVKPANVMLVHYGTTTSRARARLTDFGIAAELASVAEPQGTTTGTAAYLSPEQAGGENPTAASDVYALGLTLLECFTRRLAFPGDDKTATAIARLDRDPEIPDDLPFGWTDLLRRMTARVPHHRPAMAELTIAFRQAVIAAMGRHRVERQDWLAD